MTLALPTMTPKKKFVPAAFIDTISGLEDLAAELAGSKRLAVDMESDGFFVYHEKVCLLQMSTEENDYVIDPLAVKDLSPLGPLFRDPSVEKIFHAGEYDVLCLKRDFGFTIETIFDTMAASRALGAAKLGLAHAIELHFGVRLSKKLQRANWGKRPLSPEQLQYAQLDTHYLIALRDILHAQLAERGLLKDANDEFKRLERLVPSVREFDPLDFWRLAGARALAPQKRAVLRSLYLFRERKAAALDRAPFRVLPEPLLVKLAEAGPDTLDALRLAKGMTPYLFSNYGRELLAAVEQGLKAPPEVEPPERPQRDRWDTDTLRRYEALREWRKKLADERGVNPVVILATEEIRELALAPCGGAGSEAWLKCLSEHKRDSYGKTLLEILRAPGPVKLPRRRRRRGSRSA